MMKNVTNQVVLDHNPVHVGVDDFQHHERYRQMTTMTHFKQIAARLHGYALLPLFVLMSVYAHGQSCDYLTGTISFDAAGQNTSDLYETRYVLTKADGTIVSISSTTQFTIDVMGYYHIYGINNKIDSPVNDLTIDGNINNVNGSCLDIGAPLPITVCEEIDPCDYCLGQEVNLTPEGGTTDPGFTTKYVLTDGAGMILSIHDDANFGEVEMGLYVAFAITYETAGGIECLEVGKSITELDAQCKDINEGFVFAVCQSLTPSIFYDLKGCDITQTAILQVGETYDSYLWSTGSTRDFIEVDANTHDTFYVEVRLADGCKGSISQIVTGQERATIGDFVWEDTNNNGVQDPGENGLNGVRVELYTDFNRDGRPDFDNFPSCVYTTSNHPDTGEPGYYIFNVYESSYIVKMTAPQGYVFGERGAGDDTSRDSDFNPTSGLSGTIRVTQGQVVMDIDAGFVFANSICGRAWDDLDANGAQDENEPGYADAMVNLYDGDGELLATTLTASEGDNVGQYCFDGLTPGTYYIEMVLPNGRVLSPANARQDRTVDSDLTNANGANTTNTITITRGDRVENVDLGTYTGGSVCGIVWKEDETSENGIFNADVDSLIPFSQVQLLSDRGSVIAIADTDSLGSYCITSIPRGSYRIKPIASSVLGSYIMPNQGNDPLLDSDINPNTTTSDLFFVGPSDTLLGFNAGLRSSTVPIELVTFSGSWDARSNTNNLSWITANEINNEKFEIERALGDEDFQRIATVKGSGTTTTEQVYSHSDDDLAVSGTYYYRLKQIDYDGGYAYSNIIAIEVEKNKSVTLDVYPNPASSYLVVNTKVQHGAYYQAELVSMTGAVVKTITNKHLNKGANSVTIDVSDMEMGQYILHVTIGTQVITKKVLIMN